MKATAIIVTADNPEKVRARIDELRGAVEIIVVDDSKEDVGYPGWVKVDWNRGRRGAVNCLNIGIKMASNDIVFAIGDDVSVPDIKELLFEMERCFTLSQLPVAGFNVIDRYEHLKLPGALKRLMWEACGQLYPTRGNEYIQSSRIFTTIFAFDKRRIALMYDEEYGGTGFNAEVDFLLGQRMIYSPNLKVYHDYEGRGSVKMMLANRKHFLKKHFRYWRLRFLLYLAYVLAFPLADLLFLHGKGASKCADSSIPARKDGK